MFRRKSVPNNAPDVGPSHRRKSMFDQPNDKSPIELDDNLDDYTPPGATGLVARADCRGDCDHHSNSTHAQSPR